MGVWLFLLFASVGLVSSENVATSNQLMCSIKPGDPITGFGLWCANAVVCGSSGGQLQGFDGKCYYSDGSLTRMLLNSATAVRSNNHVQELAKDKTILGTEKNWQKTVDGFQIDVYESAKMSDNKLTDMLSRGVFVHNRQHSTVFLMFGERLREIQKVVGNNLYFYADDISDTTNVDQMLVGMQGFKTIVIVRDMQGVDLDALFEALPIYPIKNEGDIHRKCGYSDTQLDYRKLGRMYLDKQKLWYFADFWWWVNKDAVDFSAKAMQEVTLEQDFIDESKPFKENLREVQKMDVTIVRNKICAAFAKKFRSERSSTRPDDHGNEHGSVYQTIYDKVKDRSDLQVHQTWRHGLSAMIRAIVDMNESQEKCLLVPGEPNDNCQLSIIKLWQVAQIQLEIDIMVYDKRTFKKYADLALASSMLLILVLTVPILAIGLARQCWRNMTALWRKASTPTRVSTVGQGARGKSPARGASTATTVPKGGGGARGRSTAYWASTATRVPRGGGGGRGRSPAGG